MTRKGQNLVALLKILGVMPCVSVTRGPAGMDGGVNLAFREGGGGECDSVALSRRFGSRGLRQQSAGISWVMAIALDSFAGIVSSGIDVGGCVGKSDGVDVVFVSIDLERFSTSNPVKQVQVSIVGPAQDLHAVLAEPQRKEAKSSVLWRELQGHVSVLFAVDIDLMN